MVSHELKSAISRFRRRHGFRFRNPDDAYGACCVAAGLFSDETPGAHVLYCLGHRVTFPRRFDDYPKRDPEFFHAVAIKGVWVVDWTRRQLDPHARFPFVQHRDQFRREWIKIRRTAEELGL